MTAALVGYCWNGEHMVPLPRFRSLCDRQFVVGERYLLVEHEQRSAASHAHYFACIREAWDTLPEEVAGRFPSPEHLRKWALIKAGFRDEQTFVASSKAEARRIAAFMKPTDEYAVIRVHEALVVRWTAKSQSMRAMGRDEFQRSKTAVMDVVGDLLGVEPGQLAQRAARAA